ncbi:hypothetical protein [Spirosoma pomorum]
MKQLLFPILLTTLVACRRDTVSSVQPTFDATVQSIGGDCNLPLLNFGNRTNDVTQIAGSPSANGFYYAISLPKAYQKAGQAITTTIRQPTTSEQVVCTTMGPAYPAVVTVSVAER